MSGAVIEAGYTIDDLHAAVGEHANATRWRLLLGLPRVGSGYRLRFTHGHIVTARALRGWFGETGDAVPANLAIGRQIARQAPSLIDRVRPPYVVHHRGCVSPFFTAEAIVAEAAYGPVHVIDVRAIEAEMAP